jgi:hypothetical protein
MQEIRVLSEVVVVCTAKINEERVAFGEENYYVLIANVPSLEPIALLDFGPLAVRSLRRCGDQLVVLTEVATSVVTLDADLPSGDPQEFLCRVPEPKDAIVHGDFVPTLAQEWRIHLLMLSEAVSCVDTPILSQCIWRERSRLCPLWDYSSLP